MKNPQKSELRQAFLDNKKSFLIAAAFGLFMNMAMLVVPIYMQQIYDRVLSSQSLATLTVLTLIAIFILLGYGLLDALRGQLLVRASTEFDKKLKERVFSAMFERSVRSPQGEHAHAAQDLELLRQFIAGPALTAIFDIPWAPLFVIVIYLLHPLLGHIAVAGSILLFALGVANEYGLRKPMSQVSRVNIKVSNFLEASLNNAEVLKAMGMLPAIRDRWNKEREGLLALQTQAGDRASNLTALTKFVRLVMQLAIVGTSAMLAIDQHITPGAMIAASILLSRALAPAEQAVGAWRQFVVARLASIRLNELLAAIRPETPGLTLPKPIGALSVEQVLVAPPGSNAPTLKNVSFKLEAGETLGIIGPSAAGKSSLARILVGVWTPLAGTVRLDGADLKTWDHANLGPHIGYLPQDVELFDGTVAENIARLSQFSSEDVIATAQKAGVHELILRLPQGYDTPVGAGGRTLSGGMRQRIGLARALYGSPSFVVLDEPNANLDNDGELALAKTLRLLKAENCTVVLIAHRPSILTVADKILALRNGAVELFGPRDMVLARFVPQMAQIDHGGSTGAIASNA